MKEKKMQPKKDMNLSRRRFVIGSSIAGVAVAAGGATLGAIRINQSQDLNSTEFASWEHIAKGNLSDFEYIVMCANLAPSPHNTQPWSFRIGENHIDVISDFSRNIGTADPKYRQIYQGIGCAIENLAVSARYLGYKPDISLAQVKQAPDDFRIRVNLIKSKDSSDLATDAELTAIFDRQTNRSKYDMNTPIPASLLDQIANTSVGGAKIRLIDQGQDETVDLVSFLRLSTRNLVRDPQYFADSSKWWRYNREEIKGKKDGISIFTSEAPFFVKEGFERFVDEDMWMSSFGPNGEINEIDKIVNATPVWGVIWMDESGPQSWIRSGQTLERIYLLATQNNFCIHPVNYIVEDDKYAEMLKIKMNIENSASLTTLFRMGAAKPVEKSPRREWSTTLI